MSTDDDIRRIIHGEYCGCILHGNFSRALKRRVATCILGFQDFDKIGSPVIPYISAWREEKEKRIWYEFTGSRFMELLDCAYSEVAEVFRNRITHRHIYQSPATDVGVKKEIMIRQELDGARKKLREEVRQSGEIEAVYKVSLNEGRAVWLKDQAMIEVHELDRICLSLGCLTIVSKEMKAEDELERHRDHLDELVKERTADLLNTNIQLKQEIAERKKAEEKLQQSYNKLQKTMDGIIRAISLTVEQRDPYTAGHQRRTTHLATAIAEEMGLSTHQIKGIRMAGLIHDMGKLFIPAGILNKPGKLNELEFQLIKRHPQLGHEILKGIDFPWPVDEIVLQHHERFDGSGYPQGLTGRETHIEAKILAVADVVETVTSHRPYRPGFGIDKALEEISRKRGVLYDPEIVDACLRVFKERDYQLEKPAG